MKTISWAVCYEGNSDAAYFGVLIPRVIENIIQGNRTVELIGVPSYPSIILGERDRSRAAVAREICVYAEAFELLFLHSDAGGRSVQGHLANRTEAVFEAAGQICGWRQSRGIVIAPIREMEAWALADCAALKRALGISARSTIVLPRDGRHVERLPDPKQELSRICAEVSGRRRPPRPTHVLAAIAQEQEIERLRECPSFQAFEANLIQALADCAVLAVDP